MLGLVCSRSDRRRRSNSSKRRREKSGERRRSLEKKEKSGGGTPVRKRWRFPKAMKIRMRIRRRNRVEAPLILRARKVLGLDVI